MPRPLGPDEQRAQQQSGTRFLEAHALRHRLIQVVVSAGGTEGKYASVAAHAIQMIPESVLLWAQENGVSERYMRLSNAKTEQSLQNVAKQVSRTVRSFDAGGSFAKQLIAVETDITAAAWDYQMASEGKPSGVYTTPTLQQELIICREAVLEKFGSRVSEESAFIEGRASTEALSIVQARIIGEVEHGR